MLIPVIAAVSYEIIRFTGFHEGNSLVRMIAAPSLMLQRLTTRTPDEGQIEVAIQAMEHALKNDREPAGEQLVGQ